MSQGDENDFIYSVQDKFSSVKIDVTLTYKYLTEMLYHIS